MYRIRDLREDHDLTQAQIAKVLKTTQQQYSKIEKDWLVFLVMKFIGKYQK